MDRAQQKRVRRQRAHARIRRTVAGTPERPRLAVFKSQRFIYAQVIDDVAGKTLVQASSGEAAIREQAEGSAKTRDAARLVGEAVAQRAKDKGIDKVVFDRGGYIFHGKIKQLAEGARSKGLSF